MVRILGAVIMTGAMAFTIAGCLNTESEETAPAQSTVIDETRYSSDNTAPVTDTVPAALKTFNKIYNSRNFIRYLNDVAKKNTGGIYNSRNFIRYLNEKSMAQFGNLQQ